MRLTDIFLLLEQKDRLAYLVKTFQNKLIKKFQSDHKDYRLHGDYPRIILHDIKKENLEEAAKNIVNFFAEYDPNTNKKHTDWIIRQWLNDNLLWEDAYKMTNLITDFETYRKKLPNKDLNQYKDYRVLQRDLQPLIGQQVAGVRVNNFLKKEETRKYVNNITPDPDNEKINELLKDREENRQVPPDWFRERKEEQAKEDFEANHDIEDYQEQAALQLGLGKDDPWDDAVDDIANQLYQTDMQYYIERSTEEYLLDQEWDEYLESTESEFYKSLKSIGKNKPELEVIYQTDRIAVFIPNTEKASCYIGKGTQWCTASEKAHNYFWEYRVDGPIYTILTDKMGKFQFHFESAQFMDIDDIPIERSNTIAELVTQYPELETVFSNKAEDFYEYWLMPVSKLDEKILTTLHYALLGEDKAERFVSAGRQPWDKTKTTDFLTRFYKVHKKNLPPEWVQKFNDGFVSRMGVNAAKFGLVKDDEISPEVIENIVRDAAKSTRSTDANETLDWVIENNIELSQELWTEFALGFPRAIFFMPEEYITPELTNTYLNRLSDNRRVAIRHNSTPLITFMEMYTLFTSSLHRDSVAVDNPKRSIIDRNAAKIFSYVTKEHIIASVDQNITRSLETFEDFFGDFPWIYAIEKNQQVESTIAAISSAFNHVMMRKQNSPKPINLGRDKIISMLLKLRPADVIHLAKFVETPNALNGFAENVEATIIRMTDWRRATAMLDQVSEWIPPFLEKNLYDYIAELRLNAESAKS